MLSFIRIAMVMEFPHSNRTEMNTLGLQVACLFSFASNKLVLEFPLESGISVFIFGFFNFFFFYLGDQESEKGPQF